MNRTLASLLLGLPACPPTAARAAGAFRLANGSRVVLLGNTLIEREQRYGYWEAAIVGRHPDKGLVLRNLGWSGDTVFGHARGGFGAGQSHYPAERFFAGPLSGTSEQAKDASRSRPRPEEDT